MAERWKCMAPGLYKAGRYAIEKGKPPGRFWLLKLDGSVFGLKVPSRFPTIREAQQAAEIDIRKREGSH